MKKALFSIAKSENQAASIVNQLRGAGFSDDSISVLLPGQAGNKRFAHVQHTKAPEGAMLGAVGGLALGGVVGWLVGIGMVAIPGLAPLMVAGPVIAALAGAGVGAAAGVGAGCVIGVQMPEFEALQYEGKMEGGNILISVLTGDTNERRQASGIFKNAGSVTAAEAVVDHAYNRPSGAVGVAMTPSAQELLDAHSPEHVGPAAR